MHACAHYLCIHLSALCTGQASAREPFPKLAAHAQTRKGSPFFGVVAVAADCVLEVPSLTRVLLFCSIGPLFSTTMGDQRRFR